MEACLKRNSIACYHKVYSQILRREELQDAIIPDRLPDLASVLTVSGCVLIRSKDVSAGRVRLEANVPARLSYYAEDGSICCLDVNIPFYVSAEDPAIPDGGNCVAGLHLAELDAKVLNPRKVSVHASVSVTLECYQAGETEFLSAPEEGACPIHAQERSAEITVVQAMTEKTFVLTDEVILPAGKTAMEELLGYDVVLTVEDRKSLGSKLLLKGSAKSRILYRGPEMEVDTAEFSTAFSQMVDLDCGESEPFMEVQMLVSGLYYDIAPGYDGRTVKMELHAAAQVRMLCNMPVRYLADAYRNSYELALRRENREIICCRQETGLHGTLRLQMELPQEICELGSCAAQVTDVSAEGGDTAVQVALQLLCRGTDGRFLTLTREGKLMLHGEFAENERLLIGAATVEDASAALDSGCAEIRVDVELTGISAAYGALECISGIEYDENAARDLSGEPSVVIMRVRNSDDLWRIARENCSTVEAIEQANDLDWSGSTWEKLVLIPRAE